MPKRTIDLGSLERFRNRARPAAETFDRLPGGRFGIENADDTVPELYLYGEIGDWDISAAAVADALRDVKRKKIRVRINSPGGDIFHGVAIYNLLARRTESTEIFVDALAASIASVICMAGDEVTMEFNAMMMIHRAWSIVAGDADDLEKMADVLEQLEREQIIPTYQARTNLAAITLANMMAEETWMDSATAIEKGFADKKASAKPGAKAMVRPGVFAKLPREMRAGATILNEANMHARMAEVKRDMEADERRARARQFENMSEEAREEWARNARRRVRDLKRSL